MIQRTLAYLKDVRSEMAQVSWPSLLELWGSTKVVLVSVALLSLVIGLFDILSAEVVTLLLY